MGGGGIWAKYVNDFKARVIADGGTMESPSCAKSDVKFLVQNPEPVAFTGLLNDYSGAAAAYSLRLLDNTYTGNAIVVRRSSDNTTQAIGFVNNELDTATLESFVNSGNVFTDPDITGPSGFTLGSNTTYNASTEAFDLLNENGLTVRQSKAVAGHTYNITIVIDSVTSGGVKIYAGGAQSAAINTAGTHTLTITSGTSNNILGLNPSGLTTCSISSFYAVDTTADGFVTTWYDQSGNGNDATQTTAGSQPKIVSSGSTILESSKPALSYDGGSDQLTSTFGTTYNQPTYSFLTHNFTSAPSAYDGLIGSIGTEHRLIMGGSLEYTLQAGGALRYNQYSTNQSLVSYKIQSSDPKLFFNGTQQSVSGGTQIGTSGLQGVILGGIESGSSNLNAPVQIQELVIYGSDQDSNRTGIETNINDHYSIY